MPCNHRFLNDLYPQYKLRYLFVGTFNPEWNNPNGNNANWFYGRRTNSFWRILPETFGHNNMNTAQNRQNPEIWKNYCIKNGIGLTDIIEKIIDANIDDNQNEIYSFLDNQLEEFQQIQLTDILKLIKENKDSLKRVYFTRYCHTLSRDGVLLNRWNQIRDLCDELNIHNSCLVTPSNGYRMPVNEKIELWLNTINH
ncbi:MAG: hypothetical protein KGZ87_04750 [Bacteroidetes bacterium]|nr:hypothetical protein [Bacteroidota bacterium]